MSNNSQKSILDNLIDETRSAGIEPKQDLWSGIESNLNRKQEPQGYRHAFWYGALAASVAIITFIGGWQLSLQGSSEHSSALYTLAKEMNNEQTKQVNQLVLGYQNAGYHQVSEGMLSELEQLELARKEITQALKNSPSDPELLDLLIWVNQQELNLLNQSYQANDQRMQEI